MVSTMALADQRRSVVTRLDVLVAVALGIIAALVTWLDALNLSQGSAAFYSSDDIWFESDTYRRYASMIARDVPYPITNKHPLFALFTYPITKFWILLGLTPLAAVQVVLAGAAAGWIVAVYGLLRLAGCPVVDASVYTLLAKTTGAALFWSPVPEAFSLGVWSLLAPLIVLALSNHAPVRDRWFVLTAVASLAYTVSNWMAAVAAVLDPARLRRMARILTLSLALAAGLWGVQRAVIPATAGLSGMFSTGTFLLYPPSGGPLVRLRTLVVHSVVMPQVELRPRALDQKRVLTIQHAAVGSGSTVGTVAAIAWLLLLGVGAWSSWRAGAQGGLRRALWFVIAGQIALHLLYGDEMLLYTLHLVPLLVSVAAMTSLGRYRMPGLWVAGALVALLWVNNRAQLTRSAELMYSVVSAPVDETQPR